MLNGDPAIRSRIKRDEVYFSFQHASMRGREGQNCEEVMFFTIIYHPYAHHLSYEWQVKEALIIQIKPETKTRRSGFSAVFD